MKILLTILALMCSVIFVSGQTTKELNLKKKGESYIIKEQYDSAIVVYTELKGINKWNFEYTFMLGFSIYSSSKRSKEEAIIEFEKIIKYRRTNEFPETYYYLGRCYQFTGRFKEANESYNKFMTYIQNTKAGRELRSEINEYIKSTFMAIEMKSRNEGRISTFNAGSAVNSEYDEYSPVVLKDDLSMIFFSKKVKTDTENQDYSYYFYYTPDKDIYQSDRASTEGDFQDPKSIGDKVQMNPSIVEVKDEKLYFSEGKYGNLSVINPNSDTIFVALDDKKGYGGKDIYVGLLNDDGTLSNLTNLGDVINSKEDEVSPFFDFNKRELYFSTTNFEGLGGFDIYKSKLNNGTWSTPKNMEYPINSPLDDFNFVINSDGTKAYYSSGREGGYGGLDIYYVEFTQPGSDNIAVVTENKSEEPEQKTETTQPDNLTASASTQDVLIPVKGESNIIFNDSTITSNIKSFTEKEELKTYLKSKISKGSDLGTLDTIFVVQIGAYRQNIPVSYFKGFKEVIALLKEDKLYRYYVIPRYNSVGVAVGIKKSAIRMGYEGSFVTTILFD